MIILTLNDGSMRSGGVLTLIFFFFLSVFISSPSPSYGYDPLDPDSNITMTWDLIVSDSGNSQIRVSIFNFQQYRHIDEPGWQLSWDWKGEEVIWNMQGAEAVEQGDCTRFKGAAVPPHCCKKSPVIVDLLPGTPYNKQCQNCCKGGVLSSMTQDPTKYGAAFEMSVGGGSDNYTEFIMPENITLGVPGYSCGPALEVPPTKFPPNKGSRHWTQAVGTWSVRCIYSQMAASGRPTCCVSLSAFYNDTIVNCPKCSCNCQGSSPQNCVKPGQTPSLLQQMQDPNEESSPVVVCSQHMCPIRIHWHIKLNYREYWRVKMTLTNLNVMKNYTHWTLVVLHPNMQSITQSFSFNYKILDSYGGTNDSAMFWGINHYNDMLLQAGEGGNIQTEMLLHKDEGMFTFNDGWAFPRRIMFNGEDCVMPPPDDYPTPPKNALSFSSSNTRSLFITILLSMLQVFLVILFF